MAILMIYLVTTAAGMCMATLLYRSRLILRWRAILGVISYPALLAGCLLDVFNVVDVTQGFELILPLWLIVEGFAFASHD